MKKINYLDNLRSKAQTATQIRKIEQKRVETSVYPDEYEDEIIYTDSLAAMDNQITVQTDISFNQENLSTTWGKENLTQLLDYKMNACAQNSNNFKSSREQPQKPNSIQQSNNHQSHHQRTLSANIPYASMNRNNIPRESNIKEHEKQNYRENTSIGCLQTQYASNNSSSSSTKQNSNPSSSGCGQKTQSKVALQSNINVINKHYEEIIQSNQRQVLVSKVVDQNVKKPVQNNNYHQRAQSYQTYDNKKFGFIPDHQSLTHQFTTYDETGLQKWQTEISEEDDDEGENLIDGENEEISLQYFYQDLDKQPLMTKYQQIDSPSNEISIKPMTITREDRNQKLLESTSEQINMHTYENYEQNDDHLQLQTFEKLNSFIYDDISDYGQTTVIKDHIQITQQLDSLELSLHCGEDKDNLLSTQQFNEILAGNNQDEEELLAQSEFIEERGIYQVQDNMQTLTDYSYLGQQISPQQQFQIQVLEQMLLRDQEYRINSSFLQRQKNITPKMREILIDWMMEVGEEFMLKRETLNISVNYIDRYLSQATYLIPKNELQLIGVASMLIACKIEEVYIPRVNDFALSTDGGYTKEQILMMEGYLMKVLAFKLHPITLSNWMNWYMNMWDIYQDQSLKQYYQTADFTFKQPNEVAYQRFRIAYQILDTIILNPYYNDFDSRQLVASILYLIIGGPHMIGAFNYDYQWFPSQFQRFPPFDFSRGKKRYYQPDEHVNFYNQIFEAFLTECFGFQLEDLIESIQFVINYFALPMSFDLPPAASNNQDTMATVRFLIFQICAFIEKLRGIFIILNTQQIHGGLLEVYSRILNETIRK
eukprot:403356327